MIRLWGLGVRDLILTRDVPFKLQYPFLILIFWKCVPTLIATFRKMPYSFYFHSKITILDTNVVTLVPRTSSQYDKRLWERGWKVVKTIPFRAARPITLIYTVSRLLMTCFEFSISMMQSRIYSNLHRVKSALASNRGVINEWTTGKRNCCVLKSTNLTYLWTYSVAGTISTNSTLCYKEVKALASLTFKIHCKATFFL